MRSLTASAALNERGYRAGCPLSRAWHSSYRLL